jgi:hypothetical protein
MLGARGTHQATVVAWTSLIAAKAERPSARRTTVQIMNLCRAWEATSNEERGEGIPDWPPRSPDLSFLRVGPSVSHAESNIDIIRELSRNVLTLHRTQFALVSMPDRQRFRLCVGRKL